MKKKYIIVQVVENDQEESAGWLVPFEVTRKAQVFEKNP